MKKALFITHLLERNGAPTVLLHMIDTLLENGYKADVISMEDGPLKNDLASRGISVTVVDKPLENYAYLKKQLEQYDLVVANTMLTVLFVFMMHETNVPTLWWIHEGRAYFDLYKKIITGLNGLTSNVRILSVSPIVKDLVKEYIGTDSDIVPFAVPEVRVTDSLRKESEGIWNSLNRDNSKKPLRLIMVGALSFIKGQDIFADAIYKLPKEVTDNINIIFCYGSDEKDNSYDTLVEIMDNLSKYISVKVFDSLPHDEMLSLISTADFLIVSSRQETMSAVTAEAWMTGTPAVLSDACGISYYAKEEMRKLIYHTGKSTELTSMIEKCFDIRDSDLYEELTTSGREVYTENFTHEAFERNVLREIELASGKNNHCIIP